MTTTLDLNDYVDRPCPPWGCSLKYGHGWTDGWEDDDGVAAGEQFREHGRYVGENVHLGTRERVDEPNAESSTTSRAQRNHPRSRSVTTASSGVR